MKKYSKITLIIAFTLILTNVIAQKTKNYALYSLEDSRFLTVSADGKSIFCLEENDDAKQILVQRELLTGEILKTFKTKLPEIEINHVRATENHLFFSTFKEVEGERVGSFEGIYSINIKNEKIEKAFSPKEKMNQLKFMYLSGNSLIFTTYTREIKPIHFYNFNKKTSTKLEFEARYMVLFVSPEKNGMCFIQESGNELDDLLFCDFSNSNKITKIGEYQSDAVYSSNAEENKYPHAVIKDKKNNWFQDSYNKNRYPTSIMRVADYTELIDAYQKLDGYEYLSSVYLINNELFIGFNSMLKKVNVYNIKKPQTVKKSNLTKEQTALIDGFINERFSYIKTAIDSAVLAKVFDAKFYKITQKVLDNWGSSSSKYMASEFKGKFVVIAKTRDLTPLIKKGFKLNSDENALLFEKALDALYPLNVFAEKKKEHFMKDGKWYFVRDESFDVKKAIGVVVDKNGTITAIDRLKDME